MNSSHTSELVVVVWVVVDVVGFLVVVVVVSPGFGRSPQST